MAKRKNITTTQLALMTAAAVISLRGLPMMAQEELTMFFYIFFATFLFLIPAALVGAELGSAFAGSRRLSTATWASRRSSCNGFRTSSGIPPYWDSPPRRSPT